MRQDDGLRVPFSLACKDLGPIGRRAIPARLFPPEARPLAVTSLRGRLFVPPLASVEMFVPILTPYVRLAPPDGYF